MTNPTQPISDEALAEMRALANCDSRAGAPLGKALHNAVDVIENLRERLRVAEARLSESQLVAKILHEKAAGQE